MNLHVVGAELFHMDEGWTGRQTNKMKLTAPFRNFTNTPQKT